MKKFTVLKQFTFGESPGKSKLHKHGEVIETNLPAKIEAELVRGGFITPYREPPPPSEAEKAEEKAEEKRWEGLDTSDH